jgi:uncharacterized protein (DUF1778 family)
MATHTKDEQITFRIESDVAAWLRRAAAKRRVKRSQILRELILPAFEARHAKNEAAATGEQI